MRVNTCTTFLQNCSFNKLAFWSEKLGQTICLSQTQKQMKTWKKNMVVHESAWGLKASKCWKRMTICLIPMKNRWLEPSLPRSSTAVSNRLHLSTFLWLCWRCTHCTDFWIMMCWLCAWQLHWIQKWGCIPPFLWLSQMTQSNCLLQSAGETRRAKVGGMNCVQWQFVIVFIVIHDELKFPPIRTIQVVKQCCTFLSWETEALTVSVSIKKKQSDPAVSRCFCLCIMLFLTPPRSHNKSKSKSLSLSRNKSPNFFFLIGNCEQTWIQKCWRCHNIQVLKMIVICALLWSDRCMCFSASLVVVKISMWHCPKEEPISICLHFLAVNSVCCCSPLCRPSLVLVLSQRTVIKKTSKLAEPQAHVPLWGKMHLVVLHDNKSSNLRRIVLTFLVWRSCEPCVLLLGPLTLTENGISEFEIVCCVASIARAQTFELCWTWQCTTTFATTALLCIQSAGNACCCLQLVISFIILEIKFLCLFSPVCFLPLAAFKLTQCFSSTVTMRPVKWFQVWTLFSLLTTESSIEGQWMFCLFQEWLDPMQMTCSFCAWKSASMQFLSLNNSLQTIVVVKLIQFDCACSLFQHMKEMHSTKKLGEWDSLADVHSSLFDHLNVRFEEPLQFVMWHCDWGDFCNAHVATGIFCRHVEVKSLVMRIIDELTHVVMWQWEGH